MTTICQALTDYSGKQGHWSQVKSQAWMEWQKKTKKNMTFLCCGSQLSISMLLFLTLITQFNTAHFLQSAIIFFLYLYPWIWPAQAGLYITISVKQLFFNLLLNTTALWAAFMLNRRYSAPSSTSADNHCTESITHRMSDLVACNQKLVFTPITTEMLQPKISIWVWYIIELPQVVSCKIKIKNIYIYALYFKNHQTKPGLDCIHDQSNSLEWGKTQLLLKLPLFQLNK